MHNPKVSIIVPCYNQAQYLSEALQSVLEQTYGNWECIIVNDGSQDNTEDVVQEWVAKDARFIYLSKENGGLSSARNAGLKIVKGDYIQFLDADDTINKFKFEKQLDCFLESIDLTICDYYPFDSVTGAFVRLRYLNPFPDLANYKSDIISKWESQLSVPCHCVLFKTELLKKNSSLIFDESLLNHEDWFFWVRLFHYSSGIFNLNQSLANYRIHTNSMCKDEVKMKEGFILACKCNLNFFKNIGDQEKIKLCLEKLRILENKKKFNFNKFINLFVPPIILVFVKKIIN